MCWYDNIRDRDINIQRPNVEENRLVFFKVFASNPSVGPRSDHVRHG